MTVGPNGLHEHLIAKCGRCGAVWALDFEPVACTCGEYSPHPDDDVATVEAEDYEEALGLYRLTRANPQVSDE